MKSKNLWHYAAITLLFIIFQACKKDINSKSAQLTQVEGSADQLVVTCIPNSIQFFKTEALSQAKALPEGIGLVNKVLFFGGFKKLHISARVEIYNTSADTWTFKKLSEQKYASGLAAAGTKIGLAGGLLDAGPFSDQVDIYDVNSDTWTVSHLSNAREYIAGVGYGNLLYFAGGNSATNNINSIDVYKTIDVYNTISGSWSTLNLSVARTGIAAAATDNKILFAGGFTKNRKVTDRVDIYDVSSGTWSVSKLSKARQHLVGAGLGNLIIFGGGYEDINQFQPSEIVDIYNTSTGTWSTTQIANAAWWWESAVQGTKVFFSTSSSNSTGPSVYDICTNSWSELSLTNNRNGSGVGAADGKVLFAGGEHGLNDNNLKTVDIYFLSTLIQQNN